MNGTFNRNVVPKTDRELKHSIKRYKPICFKNIEIDGYSLKSYVIMHFKCQHTVEAMILRHISSYLSIACFNSQSVFCTTFLLKVPFISWLYIIFSIIIHCKKSKIQRF